MAADIRRAASRKKRAARIRYRIKGTGERPRLSVFRSNRNIFAQIIDDTQGKTLCQASSLDKDARKKPDVAFNRDLAREVGKRLAEKAKEQNIVRVVFDRGPYLYHGKVKALADGAREEGLDF